MLTPSGPLSHSCSRHRLLHHQRPILLPLPAARHVGVQGSLSTRAPPFTCTHIPCCQRFHPQDCYTESTCCPDPPEGPYLYGSPMMRGCWLPGLRCELSSPHWVLSSTVVTNVFQGPLLCASSSSGSSHLPHVPPLSLILALRGLLRAWGHSGSQVPASSTSTPLFGTLGSSRSSAFPSCLVARRHPVPSLCFVPLQQVRTATPSQSSRLLT